MWAHAVAACLFVAVFVLARSEVNRRSRDYNYVYDYSRLEIARLAVAVATGIRRAVRLVATGSRSRDWASIVEPRDHY